MASPNGWLTNPKTGCRWVLLPLLWALAGWGEAARMESFEDGLPPGIVAEKGKVAISDGDCQEGRHSLRWDFMPGDRLTIPTGELDNINVWTGYGGYSRSAFEVRVQTIVAPGALRVRFMAGETTAAWCEIPLVFAGWQRICYHYSWNSRLREVDRQKLAATDRIVIEAPQEGTSGTIFLDSLYLNHPVDFRKASEAIREPWRPHDPRTDPGMAGLLGPPSAEELAALDTFREADLRLYPGTVATGEQVAKFEQTAQETFGLARLEDGRVAGIGLRDWHPLADQMLAIAKAWLHTPDPALRQRLEEVFFLENDFLRQQGGVAQGAIQGMNWYGGRNHADACYLMRDPLRRSGRLTVVLRCLQYNFGANEIFRTDYADTHSMDYFYIDARYLFKIALMQEDPADTVIHLRAFSRRFSQQLADTIKPDGSLYHHGFHYFAYAGGASREMANQMALMAPTPFRVTPEAYAAVKRALLAMRWYANLRDLPLTLHGRHPGRQQLIPAAFLALAEASRPYADGNLDKDLATAYLRLDATASLDGFSPEPAPTGHVTLPYAGLGCQRRDEWLAIIRGYGKYLAAQESYNNANRHGLFFGNGYLDILGGGQPVSLPDSGCLPNQGWDWRRLDGTTVIDLPYPRMANGNGTMSERSGETFVGGVSHRGRDGLFAMVLNSSFQYRKALPDGVKPVEGHAFGAYKSYFFFADRIVCLGSGIHNFDSDCPVQTNLFQKALPTPETPVWVNGKAWTEFPGEVSPDAAACTLLDPQGTGYVLPAGHSVHVRRSHQISRDGHDKEDTEGDYACAWIDHGVNPTAASYRYVALVRTTPGALAQFAQAMPVWIARQDDAVHACYDRGTRTWGIACFQPGVWQCSPPPDIPDLPLREVHQPCLLMASITAAGELTFSVVDPDLDLDKRGISQPRTVELVLAGRWTGNPLPTNATLANQDGNTLLTLSCREGKTTELVVRPGVAPE